MRQVAITPDRLGKTEQERQEDGEAAVADPAPKKGPVDEVVGDRVGVPPQSQQVPIMTQADQLLDTSHNAYGKVTTALTVLREVVLGRELFDFAFRTYAERWKFKRPMPADFFRTMEDASGVDLDWFWRGWFYTTDHVDVSIDDIRKLRINTRDPGIERDWDRRQEEKEPKRSYELREQGEMTRINRFPELKDFYNENDKHTVSNKDLNEYDQLLDKLEDWQKEAR